MSFKNRYLLFSTFVALMLLVSACSGGGGGGGETTSTSSDPLVGLWEGSTIGGEAVGGAVTLMLDGESYEWNTDCWEDGVYTSTGTTITFERESGDCAPTFAKAQKSTYKTTLTYQVDGQTLTIDVGDVKVYGKSGQLKMNKQGSSGDSGGSADPGDSGSDVPVDSDGNVILGTGKLQFQHYTSQNTTGLVGTYVFAGTGTFTVIPGYTTPSGDDFRRVKITGSGSIVYEAAYTQSGACFASVRTVVKVPYTIGGSLDYYDAHCALNLEITEHWPGSSTSDCSGNWSTEASDDTFTSTINPFRKDAVGPYHPDLFVLSAGATTTLDEIRVTSWSSASLPYCK